MKITDRELPIDRIISVRSGRISRKTAHCPSRTWDGFIYVLSGKARYTFENSQFTVNRGDVFYLAKDSRYDISILQQEYRYICVDFLFHTPEGRIPDSEAYKPGSGKAVENAFVKMLNLWKLRDFSDQILCKAVLYEVYAAIVKSVTMAYLATDQRQRLEGVMAYINEHYTDPELTITALAEQFGTSEVHFRRIFTRRYRTSPIRFITALRLNKARELLVNTDLSIRQICTECGYTSVYYFDRIFKKTFGMQPTQFRDQGILS